MDLIKKYYIVRTVGEYSKKENDRRFDERDEAKKCFDNLSVDLYRQAAIIEVTEKAVLLKCH